MVYLQKRKGRFKDKIGRLRRNSKGLDTQELPPVAAVLPTVTRAPRLIAAVDSSRRMLPSVNRSIRSPAEYLFFFVFSGMTPKIGWPTVGVQRSTTISGLELAIR